RDLVQPLLLVALDAQRQQAALPEARGGLEPGEPAHDLDDAARSFEAARGLRVLPGGQEAEEVGGGDRLDLLAQAFERRALDARQEPAVAPGVGAADPHAQDRALALEGREQR